MSEVPRAMQQHGPRTGRRVIVTSDSVVALALAGLGAGVMLHALKLGLGALDLPGPGLFPFAAGAMTFAAAGVVFAACVTRPASLHEAGEEMFEPAGLRALLLLLAIFAAWIVLMPLAGFVIVTFFCVLAFAKAMRLEGWTKPLLLSLATAAGVYVMFAQLLQLDLPSGPWGQG